MTLKLSSKLVNDTEGTDRATSEKKMNQELGKVFRRWDARAEHLVHDELRIRYEWALDVQKIRSRPDTYADGAIDLLFDAMGMDRTQIPVYSNVATFISQPLMKEIHLFNKHDNSRHGRITWSHLVQLSRLCNPVKQEQLLAAWRCGAYECCDTEEAD